MHFVKKERGNSKQFTLIELLVVIAIIAILAAILMPALSSARERGRSAACISNLKQIALGCQGYTDDFNGWLPRTCWAWRSTSGGTGADVMGREPGCIAGGEYGLKSSWMAYLSSGKGNCGGTSSKIPFLKYLPTTVDSLKGVYICPSDPDTRMAQAATTSFKARGSYVMSQGVGGGNYNAKIQTNWLHINDFSKIVPYRGNARRSPGQHPWILDGANKLNSDNQKQFSSKSGINVTDAEGQADINNWIEGGIAGLGARHNACVNTAFVDGHAKSIMAPVVNTHGAEKYVRWLSPYYQDCPNVY